MGKKRISKEDKYFKIGMELAIFSLIFSTAFAIVLYYNPIPNNIFIDRWHNNYIIGSEAKIKITASVSAVVERGNGTIEVLKETSPP